MVAAFKGSVKLSQYPCADFGKVFKLLILINVDEPLDG